MTLLTLLMDTAEPVSSSTSNQHFITLIVLNLAGIITASAVFARATATMRQVKENAKLKANAVDDAAEQARLQGIVAIGNAQAANSLGPLQQAMATQAQDILMLKQEMLTMKNTHAQELTTSIKKINAFTAYLEDLFKWIHQATTADARKTMPTIPEEIKQGVTYE